MYSRQEIPDIEVAQLRHEYGIDKLKDYAKTHRRCSIVKNDPLISPHETIMELINHTKLSQSSIQRIRLMLNVDGDNEVTSVAIDIVTNTLFCDNMELFKSLYTYFDKTETKLLTIELADAVDFSKGSRVIMGDRVTVILDITDDVMGLIKDRG